MLPTMHLAQEWVDAMRRRGLSPGTITARRGVLTRWREYLVGQGLGLDTATADDIDRWLDRRGVGLSSRYTAISHLHAFYRWAQRAGFSGADPTLAVDRPRLSPGLPRPMHPTDLTVAVSLADDLTAAALLLGAGCGLRCCEIARVRWDDIHDGYVRVVGKGNKERVVPMHPALEPVLERIERTSIYVLDGWQSAQVDNPGIRTSQRLNGYLRSVGIAATAHQLRHYAATYALRNSHDLRAVQKFLGHASPSTTAIYTLLDVDDMRAMVEAIPIGSPGL